MNFTHSILLGQVHSVQASRFYFCLRAELSANDIARDLCHQERRFEEAFFSVYLAGMHLVILHGYLLGGTGSNIYSCNVAKTWKRLGHAVTVVCQDRRAGGLEFVDECVIGTENVPEKAPQPGKVRVVVPDIDGLLLVYVHNKYEGFRVKELRDSQCTFDEIENHIEKTSLGLRRVLAQGVDRVLANHALLSPVIAKRACAELGVPYIVKIHGSALLFGLKERAELMRYAEEGLASCEKIVAGTKYIVNVLREHFKDISGAIGLEKKVVIVPPGMDPDLFQPSDEIETNQRRFLEKVSGFIARKPGGRNAAQVSLPSNAAADSDLHASFGKVVSSYDQWAVDADLPSRFPRIQPGEPVICYFGAYLGTKGIGELLVAFISVLERVPVARLLLIGYGGYREHMEGMLKACVAGDVDSFVACARAGDFMDSSPEQLRRLFRPLSAEQCQRITLTGILEHDQLREILPVASVSVMVSKASEAFGMVTVEAMASGVLPISHYHSGIADVLDVVRQHDGELDQVMRLEPSQGGKFGCANGAVLVEALPDRLLKALEFLYPNGYHDNAQRKHIAARLRQIAVENFSWEKICKSLL